MNYFKILTDLETVFKSALTFDESELIRAIEQAENSNIPRQLINKCLSLGNSQNKIESIRLTLLAELRQFKFSEN